ncbi:unnamed protein product [Ambrosiozyma monospora]|uniref:Unnamed protein product n=1 Tax=Ambrosiozyma monospora TaxID=43982 RepID=A0ACB5TAI9_AMBMO|nr:unnamed protein product [Ambrosiozyma monospora]
MEHVKVWILIWMNQTYNNKPETNKAKPAPTTPLETFKPLAAAEETLLEAAPEAEAEADEPSVVLVFLEPLEEVVFDDSSSDEEAEA